MADLAPYRAVLSSRIRSQLAYRRSFALDVSGSAGVGLLEFLSVYVIFTNVTELGGLDFAGVALVFAFANLGFSLADIVVGHVDALPTYLRSGTLDAFLLRPLSVLGQLVTSDVQLRRLGRCAVGVAILAVALPQAGIDWGWGAALLVVAIPLVGAVIFAAVFVAAAAAQFWLVDGAEFTNAFVYGGSNAASYPTSVFTTPLRAAVTFVLPAAFTAYLPTLLLLGEPGPAWTPAWLGWFAPVAAVVAWVVALTGWKAGLRHYTGTGS